MTIGEMCRQGCASFTDAIRKVKIFARPVMVNERYLFENEFLCARLSLSTAIYVCLCTSHVRHFADQWMQSN